MFFVGAGIPAHAAVIFQDTFDDNNFTVAQGANGLSWRTVQGRAVIAEDNGSLALGLYAGALLVTQQTLTQNEFTAMFDASIRWGVPGRFVFLYKDVNNYYSVGLGQNAGLYRRLDGVETKLAEDAGSFVRLPHAGPARGRFKIYVKREAQGITLKVDRMGDGVDYDVEVVDKDPIAVARFAAPTAIAVSEDGSNSNSLWTLFDNIAVDDTFVSLHHTVSSLYVDASTGDDARTYDQAKNPSTPWKTIQKAADSVFTGDTVLVQPGVYPERVNFTGRHLAGKPGSLVIFKSAVRHQAECYGFNMRYGDYVRIEGFSVYHNLPGWYERLGGIVMSGNYSEAVDNYIHDLAFAGITGDGKGYRVIGNKIFKGAMGISVGGEDWLVENNEVDRLIWPGDGDSDYSRFFGKRGTMRGNTFHGARRDEIGMAHVDGFQTFNDNGEIVEDIVLENNFVESFHQGVIIQDNRGSRSIKNITVRNNIFVGGELTGGWGICETGILNLNILNNAFIDLSIVGVGFSNNTTGSVKNNIFYSGGGIWSDETSVMDEDYNLISGNTVPSQNGAPKSGTHTLLTTDPLFKNIWVSRIDLSREASLSEGVAPASARSRVAVGDIVEYKNDGVARTVTALRDIDANSFGISFAPALSQGSASSYLHVWKANSNVQEDYRLQPQSPAIDRGAALVEFDRTGLRRPLNLAHDIGPWETDCLGSCVQCWDADQDGYAGTGSCNASGANFDCNDNDSRIHPGATELCDGIDNNCNHVMDDGFPQGDEDADGLVYCRDNCSAISNASQSDGDGDGKGDACDAVFTYREDFESRLNGTKDLAGHKTSYDFAWNARQGGASVENSANGKWMRMSAVANQNTLMVTDKTFGEAQISVDFRSQWNSSGGMTFLVQDQANYYVWIFSGNGDSLIPNGPYAAGGLFKVVNGRATLLGSEPGLATTHNSGDLTRINSATVKTTFLRDGLHIQLTLVRQYDSSIPVTREWVDPAPATVSGFAGFLAIYAQYNTIRFDNLAVEPGEGPPFIRLNVPPYLDYRKSLQVEVSAGLPLSEFVWTIQRQSAQGAMGASAAAPGSSSYASFRTPSPSVTLADYNFGTGSYLIRVQGFTSTGKATNIAEAQATLIPGDFSEVRVYPNPWRADRHSGDVTFSNLPANSSIKLFSTSGHLVRDLGAGSGEMRWNLKNESGDRVASGIYLYLIEADGQKTRGKVAVIR